MSISTIIGWVFSGFSVRIGAGATAVWMATKAMTEFSHVCAQIHQVLPH